MLVLFTYLTFFLHGKTRAGIEVNKQVLQYDQPDDLLRCEIIPG